MSFLDMEFASIQARADAHIRHEEQKRRHYQRTQSMQISHRAYDPFRDSDLTPDHHLAVLRRQMEREVEERAKEEAERLQDEEDQRIVNKFMDAFDKKYGHVLERLHKNDIETIIKGKQ